MPWRCRLVARLPCPMCDQPNPKPLTARPAPVTHGKAGRLASRAPLRVRLLRPLSWCSTEGRPPVKSQLAKVTALRLGRLPSNSSRRAASWRPLAGRQSTKLRQVTALRSCSLAGCQAAGDSVQDLRMRHCTGWPAGSKVRASTDRVPASVNGMYSNSSLVRCQAQARHCCQTLEGRKLRGPTCDAAGRL